MQWKYQAAVTESVKQDAMNGMAAINATPTPPHWVPGISDVDFTSPFEPGTIIKNVGHIDGHNDGRWTVTHESKR